MRRVLAQVLAVTDTSGASNRYDTHTQHEEHQLTAVLLQQTAGALCSEPE